MTGPPSASSTLPSTSAGRRRRRRHLVTTLALAALALLLAGGVASWPVSRPSDPALSASPEVLGVRSLPSVATPGPTPAWTEVPTTISPPARSDASMAYDDRDGYTVLYGGMWISNVSNGELDDTWTYARGQWSQVSTDGPPGGRGDASMAYDPVDGYLVLFGGGSPAACGWCNDTWTFTGGRWSWLDIPGPTPRIASSFAWDPVLGEMILYGGIGCASLASPNGACTDTWSFLHGRWTNLTISGPSARMGPSMAYLPAAGGLVLFGGRDESGRSLKDTWLFNGAWTQLAATGPGSRSFATSASEPTAGVGILFGGGDYDHSGQGHTIGELGDTWLFNGTSWRSVTTPGPPARTVASMVYDAADGYVLLFGGLITCPFENCTIKPGDALIALDDTWSFSLGRVAPALSVRVSPTSVCVLNDLSCAAGTWQAEVNVTVRVTYSPPPLGDPSVDVPALTVLPWGQVQLDPSAPPVASCRSSYPEPGPCGLDPRWLTAGSSAGFQLNWSSNPYLDTLRVGDAWSVVFGIDVAGPPYGSVPVYSCDSTTCRAAGTGPIDGSFSSLAFRPLSAGPGRQVSLPFANITVEPPRHSLSGSSPPVATTPPPPSALPIGLPSPVTIPTPAPVSTPVLSPLVTAVPTVSLTAIAAGILSAGFARVVPRRQLVALGQPVGNAVGSKRSTFEPDLPSDRTIGRFE